MSFLSESPALLEMSKNRNYIQEKKRPYENFLYGWGKFQPMWLQRLNKPGWLAFFMCVANFFQGMTVNGLMSAIVSTLEKRFSLSSNQSSTIITVYDLATIPVMLLYSFTDTRLHRTRWTAASLLLMVLGSTIFVMPHFLSESYKTLHQPELSKELCQSESAGMEDSELCKEQVGSDEMWFTFLVCARLIHGIGGVALYVICVTYLEDCVSNENFAFYIGIFYAMGLLGPAVGMIVGGALVRTIHADFLHSEKDEYDITPLDPEWVGAWWPLYLIAAAALFIIAIPLSGYNRDMPGGEEIRCSKIIEVYTAPITCDDESNSQEPQVPAQETNHRSSFLGVAYRDIPKYFTHLIRNTVYLLVVGNIVSNTYISAAMVAYSAKYMEIQFGIAAGTSGIVVGLLAVPSATVGSIVGGTLVKRYSMTVTQILKWMSILNVGVLLCLFAAMPFCTYEDVTLVSQQSTTTRQHQYNITALRSCEDTCFCESVDIRYVCYEKETLQYDSPCAAGCTHMGYNIKDNSTYYYNCTCIPGDHTDKVMDGICPRAQCFLYYLVLTAFAGGMLTLYSSAAMSTSVVVRVVEKKLKTFAIGVMWISLRVLGSMPAPKMTGIFIDAACSRWSYICNKRGACLEYNTVKLSYLIWIPLIVIKIIGIICMAAAYVVYKPPVPIEIQISIPKSDEPSREVSNASKVAENADEVNTTSTKVKIVDTDDNMVTTELGSQG